MFEKEEQVGFHDQLDDESKKVYFEEYRLLVHAR